jgi:hypothetical protein
MFAAASVELTGGFLVPERVPVVFELFSPNGERKWVPGWNPELLHPPKAEWERGLIFRTREELGDAVWVVTVLDRGSHEVEYYRVEASRYVARVRVRCRAQGSTQTDVSVVYTFVSLSDAGNREIAEMSHAAYEQKMKRWQGWICGYLSSRSR